MTSTRQIKKRMLRARRYADHYRGSGLGVGRQAEPRYRAAASTLRRRRIARAMRNMRKAFTRFARAARAAGEAFRRNRRADFALVR